MAIPVRAGLPMEYKTIKELEKIHGDLLEIAQLEGMRGNNEVFELLSDAYENIRMSYDPDFAAFMKTERKAIEIYNGWRTEAGYEFLDGFQTIHYKYPIWFRGGNSLKQDEARALAREEPVKPKFRFETGDLVYIQKADKVKRVISSRPHHGGVDIEVLLRHADGSVDEGWLEHELVPYDPAIHRHAV